MQRHQEASIQIDIEGGRTVTVNFGSLTASLKRASEAANGAPWEHAEQFARALLDHFISSVPETRMPVANFEEIVRFVLKNLNFDRIAEKFTYLHTHSIIDLEKLAHEATVSLEMTFYPALRQQIAEALMHNPEKLVIRGIKPCVKRLKGAKRWRKRCLQEHEEMVDYLRRAVAEACPRNLAVVIS